MIDWETRWDETAKKIVDDFFTRIEQYAPPETMEADKKELMTKISDALFSEYMQGIWEGGLEY